MYLQGQPGVAPTEPAGLPPSALVDALKVASGQATEVVEPAKVG
jgi:hypothetical protein